MVCSWGQLTIYLVFLLRPLEKRKGIAGHVINVVVGDCTRIRLRKIIGRLEYDFVSVSKKLLNHMSNIYLNLFRIMVNELCI